jgi:sulfite reductase (NADPH) flavoprotein alpha-component
MTPRPPIPSFIPESAPFSPEQRTWLNGLFAGLFGLEAGITPLSAAEAAKLIPGLIDGAVVPAPAEADDGAPWHDPAMPLPERMKLADGKPLPRRLMAAMGQQDCGQCGYNCQDYADALFAKSEKRLNLCVPGGKETARMLRELYQQLDGNTAVVLKIKNNVVAAVTIWLRFADVWVALPDRLRKVVFAHLDQRIHRRHIVQNRAAPSDIVYLFQIDSELL